MILSILQTFIVLFLYVLGASVVGIALTPGIFFFLKILNSTISLDLWPRALILGLTFAIGFFIFGLALVFLIGFLNMVLNLRLKEGEYKYGHPETMKWFFLNALIQGIKAFFIEFLYLTPFLNIFYRMMGAKLGTNVQINSKHVADLSLLEIGKNSVIGGNATVIGHVFEKGGLKLKKVRIGSNVVIGLNAVIMPGCEIGDRAVVGAGAILLKDTKVEAGEVWIGIPAKRINNN